MGVMNGLKGIFAIGDDEFYEEEDSGYLDEPEMSAPRTSSFRKDEDSSDEPTEVKKLTRNIAPRTKKGSGNGMEVCAIKPQVFEEAREITETLLSNRTVVLNLEGLDVGIAQRIIDFASGSCYAMGGNLQKISNYIFIITPASVDVSGDFNDLTAGALDVAISR